MLQPFLSVGVWFFFFLAVEHLGERSLAVINLARTISALPFIIIHAFATAANSLVSNIIGEGKINQVWRLINKFMVYAAVFVVPLLLFFVICPELTLRIYTDNPELVTALGAILGTAAAYFVMKLLDPKLSKGRWEQRIISVKKPEKQD